jgi:hypothetical protein
MSRQDIDRELARELDRDPRSVLNAAVIVATFAGLGGIALLAHDRGIGLAAFGRPGTYLGLALLVKALDSAKLARMAARRLRRGGRS